MMRRNKPAAGCLLNSLGIAVVALLLPLGLAGSSHATVPSIRATSPAANAGNVAPTKIVKATFFDAVDPLTVDESSFALDGVAGTTAYLPTTLTATFTPADPLSLYRTYTARVTTEVADPEGNHLPADVTWNFTTRDGLWQAPELVEADDTSDVFAYSVRFGPGGKAIAIWNQSEQVIARRYDTASGWGAGATLSEAGRSSIQPALDMDHEGNAIAVWAQRSPLDPMKRDIMARFSSAGSGWGAAVTVRKNAYADTPSVRFDPSGNALLLWREASAGYPLLMRWRRKTSGWGVLERFTSPNPEFLTGIDISFDKDGNALAVWQQSGNIYVKQYRPSTGWGPAALIESSPSDASAPLVRFAPDGTAIAAWRQANGSAYTLYARSYLPGTGWGTRRLVSSATGNAATFNLEIDAGGNPFFAWFDSYANRIFVKRFLAGTWTGSLKAVVITDAWIDSFSFAVDRTGNATLLSVQRGDDGRLNVYAWRYKKGRYWGSVPQLLESQIGDATVPALAVAPDGKAAALWTQYDYLNLRYSLWSNTFR